MRKHFSVDWFSRWASVCTVSLPHGENEMKTDRWLSLCDCSLCTDAPLGSLENGTGPEDHVLPEPGPRYRLVFQSQIAFGIELSCSQLCILFSFKDGSVPAGIQGQGLISHLCSGLTYIIECEVAKGFRAWETVFIRLHLHTTFTLTVWGPYLGAPSPIMLDFSIWPQ